MCLIREAINFSISRRKFLEGVGASLAAAPLLTGLGGRALPASSPSVITGPGAANFNTRLILLGTAGGPNWWPDSNRVSASSALVVGDTIYLIDLGHGATHRLAEAFNSGVFVNMPGGKVELGGPTFLQNVKALFFTHLHMDHTADYPSLLLIGYGAGLYTVPDPTDPTGTKKIPLEVYGPGNRGQLEANVLKPYGIPDPKVVYTDSATPTSVTPTPGTEQMTNILWQAFAQTINDFTYDDAYPDFTEMVVPNDITLPFTVSDPNSNTCPAMSPFQIYDDSNVAVWATLVDHHQVFPSFAFRFDTDDGSVVFSGDTGPNTAGNLQLLAKGADILVHEVIDEAWIDLTFGQVEPGTPGYALKTHLETAHTAIQAVGNVAELANVTALVLNHIVPGNTPIARLLQARRHFSGELIIGEDLMQIGVGRARRRMSSGRG